jgi:hypothetical protein
MTPSRVLCLSLATALVLALPGCDRAPSRAATPAAAGVQAGAVTTPMSPATVALSGAVSDLPAETTPDAIGLPAKPAAAAAAPGRAVRPPPPIDSGAALASGSASRGDTQAMRDFRAAQERRDRELLERDMAQSRGDVGSGASREADPVDPRDESPPDDELPIDDEPLQEDEALPPDELPADELPADELPPEIDEELPPEEDDGDLRWDPATGTWR